MESRSPPRAPLDGAIEHDLYADVSDAEEVLDGLGCVPVPGQPGLYADPAGSLVQWVPEHGGEVRVRRL